MDWYEAEQIREFREAFRKEIPKGGHIKSITNTRASSEPSVLNYAGYRFYDAIHRRWLPSHRRDRLRHVMDLMIEETILMDYRNGLLTSKLAKMLATVNFMKRTPRIQWKTFRKYSARRRTSIMARVNWRDGSARIWTKMAVPPISEAN